MPFYSDLNEVKLDLKEIDDIPLSPSEERRLLKQVHQHIHPLKRKKKRLGIALAAAAVFILSLSLSIEKGTIASMPFIGESIEKYINQIEPADYTSYKTAIGQTAENELGRLTLNEVMVDDRHLFLSATFEPAEDVAFDYQTHIQPTVKVNGEELAGITSGQSIELNNSMFTIYNDIELDKGITTEELSIEISYDTWNFEKTIDQPWLFDVNVSQKKLLEETKEFALNQKISLTNGERITVKRVVSTPISTTLYYDLSHGQSEDVHVNIEAADGTTDEFPGSSYVSNEPGQTSFQRFEGLVLADEEHFIVVRNTAGEQLSDPIAIK